MIQTHTMKILQRIMFMKTTTTTIMCMRTTTMITVTMTITVTSQCADLQEVEKNLIDMDKQYRLMS